MARVNRHISKEVIIASPAAATHVLWRAPIACKVTAVRAWRVGGTSVVVKAIKNSTDLTASNLTAGNAAWAAATLSATAAALRLAAGDTLKVEVVSAAGTPTSATVQVDLVTDADA